MSARQAIDKSAFVTPGDAPRWKRLALYSPVARMLIFFALSIALVILFRVAFVSMGWVGPAAPVPQRDIASMLIRLVPMLAAYLFLVRVVERRWPSELAWRNLVPHTALGIASGALLISAVVAVLFFAGSYEVIRTDADPHWVRQLMVGALGAAVGEEIMTRGVIFRISEEGLGTWGALIISALLFGLGHIFNPGATAWTSIAIAIEAGLLLGLLFHVTRSLWICIGLHMGWNFVQGTVWGIPVSGVRDSGWLVSERPGPEWLSGGPFGVEASVVSVALCSAVTVALLVIAVRRQSLVAPWFRRRAAPAVDAADNESSRTAASC